jgi:hypothetical protein
MMVASIELGASEKRWADRAFWAAHLKNYSRGLIKKMLSHTSFAVGAFEFSRSDCGVSDQK